MKPRPVVLLCVALWIIELAKVAASLILLLILFQPSELSSLGLLREIGYDIVVVIALLGISYLRWWGIGLYTAMLILQAVVFLRADPLPQFALLMSLAMLLLMFCVVVPYRKSFS